MLNKEEVAKIIEIKRMGNGPKSLEKNKKMWNDEYPWPQDGEEWSDYWGGSKAQWYGCLFPRIAKWMPSKTILEIAPGHGRWTRFLIEQCTSYQGVDLSENCIDFCKERFQNFNHASFFCNDGCSLSMIQDHSCDFVFSFDSLVHAEFDVLESYLSEILRVLKPKTGMAFIHHSNAGEYFNNPFEVVPYGRARSVTASAVDEFINSNMGGVWIQEKIDWTQSIKLDCITLFGACKCMNPIYIENFDFMCEAQLIKKSISKYFMDKGK